MVVRTTADATPLGPAIDKLEERGIAVSGVLDEVEKRLRLQVETSADFVEQTARYLMDAINGQPHHGTEYLPCRLIQRESTLPLD